MTIWGLGAGKTSGSTAGVFLGGAGAGLVPCILSRLLIRSVKVVIELWPKLSGQEETNPAAPFNTLSSSGALQQGDFVRKKVSRGS